MILLDIPQGAITIASAILVVVGGALVTFAAFVFRQLFSIRDRLKAVETTPALLEAGQVQQLPTTIARTEILWEMYNLGVLNLLSLGPPRNPMEQERWDELVHKLHRDEISDAEAEEFLAALLKRQEQAREEKDLAALAILGPGILLTKWKLKEKELREQK